MSATARDRFFELKDAPPSSVTRSANADSRASEYTIDELARASGLTVRNVRAYQDKGLIAPPERRGRTGYYTDAHLSKLRVIQRLSERGYTLSSIDEMLQSWEQGNDLGSLLGIEEAISSPWSDELPDYVDLADLTRRFRGAFNPAVTRRALKLGVLQREGARFRVPSPRLLAAGEQLVAEGLPLDRMLDVLEGLRRNVEEVAESMVTLFKEHVLTTHQPGELPDAETLQGLAEQIWRLRPIVEQAVQPEVARAMEKAADRHFGDVIAQHLEQLRDRGVVVQYPAYLGTRPSEDSGTKD